MADQSPQWLARRRVPRRVRVLDLLPVGNLPRMASTLLRQV
jgi:hypothetical protein